MKNLFVFYDDELDKNIYKYIYLYRSSHMKAKT